jgi:amidohydrolase
LSGVLRGTLRTGDHQVWTELAPLVRSLVAAVLAPTGVGYVLEHQRGVPPVNNEALSTGLLSDAAVAALGPDGATSTEQSSGGEDFAWYLEEVPGAMARLGVWSGDGPMKDIHQPTFDLDERALPCGVRVLVHAALASLPA